MLCCSAGSVRGVPAELSLSEHQTEKISHQGHVSGVRQCQGHDRGRVSPLIWVFFLFLGGQTSLSFQTPAVGVFPLLSQVHSLLLASTDCHELRLGMASFPSYGKTAGTVEEENGELDQSLQHMLKAIADERNRLNSRQEISGLGE